VTTFDTITANLRNPFARDDAGEKKFGTIDGVFLPTVLTILGAVMYLRTGWVVGNAGLLGGALIILLANVITLATGLSIASVATNIRMGAGGAFSIIAQSLGLEVSGSVTVPFYLAQAISVAFYIFAFSEGWLRIFPNHPAWAVVFGAFGVIFAIAYFSVSLAVRVRYPILIIIIASLIVVFLGSFHVWGAQGITQTPELWGSFPAGNFWSVFAVFFPAVTGVLAGVNMSGTLKNPRHSIPRGLISAIVVTMVVYLGLAYWVSLVATPAELVSNFTIMVDRSVWGPAVLAGILAATFSAALNSLVGAPRVLRAITEHDILPGGEFLAKRSASGEPRNAMWVTGGIALVTLLFGLTGGGLNAIAPLMTMFFLITYAVLNGVVVLEQSLGLISFRPHFKIPRIVPIIGVAGSVITMFLINPLFSLVAVVVIIGLYVYLSHRQLKNPFSDVRSGLFVTLAEWAAMRVITMPSSQERAWRPSLLVPAQSELELLGCYRFLKALTYPRGSVHLVGIYRPGKKFQVEPITQFVEAFTLDGIFARAALVESDDFQRALHAGLDVLSGTFFHPTALFLPVNKGTKTALLQRAIDRAKEDGMGAILYAQHPSVLLGREQTINVWIREQSPNWEIGMRLTNLDLSLLLAYQLRGQWQGTIRLITVIADETERANAEEFFSRLIDLGRMPRNTCTIVSAGKLDAFLPHAPQADLNIFGLQTTVSVRFVEKMVGKTKASCIFVRDSGNESALA